MKNPKSEHDKTLFYFKLWFAFILVVVLSMFGYTAWIAYTLVTMDTDELGNIIGSFLGSIQDGMEK